MAKRKVLAFSFFPAFVRPNNGGVERLYNIYSALAEQYDVTLISSAHLGGEREVIPHSPSFTEIRIPKDNYFADSYAELSKSSGEGDLSGPALGQSSRRFGALHDEYLVHYADADIIIHDSPFLIECDLFRGFDEKVRIYNSYNCETDLYRSFHSISKSSKVIEDLVRNLEQDLCRHANLITVCAQEDLEAFQREFLPVSPIVLVPNGYTPGAPCSDVPRQPDRVVFLGSAHKPNIDAVRYIVNEIAPRMRDVEFHLIGSCHAKGRAKNVVAHGIISHEAKEALLRSAAAAINPMTSGSGSSLKIADIASNGTPLISTDLGARGFGLEQNVHYIPIDDKDPVRSIRGALDDAASLRLVATSSLEHFERNYTWRHIVGAFAEQIEGIAPPKLAARPRLILNDYDSLGAIGGGATRTRGLCRGLAETSPIVFIAFAEDNQPSRRVVDEGRILSLLVDKNPDHLAEHDEDNRQHWVSTADVVNYVHAPKNKRLLELFRGAASISSAVVCEHAYMVGVPRAFAADFVYSSQNFELGLKRESLRDHPRSQQLLSLVREAEAFACGAASLIIAVSESDARNFGAAYSATAPIAVVPNGAEGPEVEWSLDASGAMEARPVAIFMGSAHGPNFEAAQWIATALAPAMADIDFVILGAVAKSLDGPFAPNVQLVGQVSSIEKSRRLYSAQVALNPMMSGSGSNVKLADYLQHGLPVVTTAFGARGYEWVSSEDVVITDLVSFETELARVLQSKAWAGETRHARQLDYLPKLSMDAGGRLLASLLDEHSGARKRALYVTYRYNEPARGGGEEYVVRLVHALAASGWNVDVASPAAEKIVDCDRFAAKFVGDDWQPVPIGHSRVRSTKFPLNAPSDVSTEVRRIWNFQSDYEEHVFKALKRPRKSCLTWGWANPEAGGRWCFRSAGLYLAEPATLKLRAKPLVPLWLQLFSQDGRRLFDLEADDSIEIECQIPAGFVSIRTSMKCQSAIADPRPLAFFVESMEIGSRSPIDDCVGDIWAEENSPSEQIAALVAARQAVRDARNLGLTSLRVSSDLLDQYVRDHVGDYDLLITHNAVFKSTTAAVEAADAAAIPSILIPHLHYDDDFYHFRDVHDACARASRTLVCPEIVRQILVGEGLTNVVYHAPGVDVSIPFTKDDALAFRAVLGKGDEDFFLVLGRKSAAKGYQDVIRAIGDFSDDKAPLVVMIGPDDDGIPLDSHRVIYLGRQPRQVVRGALIECLALINMSRSESFGMVLMEAGLAGKPVLANLNCAAFADIVTDGVNGFLTTPAQLSSRMSDLCADSALRRKLGKQGRKRALKHDWGSVEKEFIDLCNSLAKAVR